MKTLDGRKISRDAQAEIRKPAVLQVQSGESPEQVIKALGLYRGCIYDWLSRYQAGGLEALESVRAPGATPKLTGTQMRELYDYITEFNPLQLNFEFALWGRVMVRELIITRYRFSSTQ